MILYGSIDSDDGLGWGFISKIGRGIKKVGKGAVKYTVAKPFKYTVLKPTKALVKYTVVGPTRWAIKANISLAKLTVKLMSLPLKYLIKAILKLGRTLCKAPPLLILAIQKNYNIEPTFFNTFCMAVKEGNWNFGRVKKFLPPALKIALKLGASGAFPPIAPVLKVVSAIPFVGRFAGADDPQLDAAVQAAELYALADYLGIMDDVEAEDLDLGEDDRETLQGVLEGSVLETMSPLTFGEVSVTTLKANAPLIVSVGAVGLGAALILTGRRR